MKAKQMANTRALSIPRRAKEILFLLVAFLVGLLIIRFSRSVLWPSLDPRHGQPTYKYGIVFDAGSTGTRINVFKLAKENSAYEIADQYFESIKPGLSAYADTPEKGADTLKPLLERAKKFVPESQWADTPVALKATAGLRLLPAGAADKLLDAARAVLLSSPFQASKNVAEILDGSNEGVYCWVTLNYYMGAFHNRSRFYGTIDLGGGSVQITFLHHDQISDNNTVQVTVFGNKFHVYSRSYLGLGLRSASHEMLGLLADGAGLEASTACLSDNATISWNFANKDYTVRGVAAAPGSDRHASCLVSASAVIQGHQVQQPAGVRHTHFCALSYFVDRASELHIVPCTSELFLCYEQRSRVVTPQWASSSKLPGQLTYMSSLLQQGFGFKDSDVTRLLKRVNGHEISWALGAMFDMLSHS